MNYKNQRCSTPVDEHINIQLNFTLSEIRERNVTVRGGNRKREKNRGIYSESKKILTGDDSSSDLEYETINTFDYNCCQEFEDDVNSLKKYNQQSISEIDDNQQLNVLNKRFNNSSPLSINLFDSPSDKNRDNYDELYFDSPENKIPSISSDPVISSSPVFQKKFRDQTEFKTYCGPGIGRKRLSPSKISFSPKWVNGRIPAKYNSPSNIPSRNSNSISVDKSPASAGWSSITLSFAAERMWEDFNKDINPMSKSLKLNEQKVSFEQPRSKYSHLRVTNEQCKRFISPTRKFDSSEKENVIEGRLVGKKKAARQISKEPLGEHRPQNNNTTLIRAQDNQCSKSSAKEKVGSSPRYDAINSSKQLKDTFREYSRSNVITDHNWSKTESTSKKNSKPKIISIEIIESKKK